MPLRPRDSQRRKLYMSERKHRLWSEATMVASEVESFAHLVIDLLRTADPQLAARNGFDKHYPLVKLLKGNGSCWARQSDRSINMRPWGFKPLVIIHEIAHIVAGCEHQHSTEFARVYIRLVSIVLGQREGNELAYAFNEGRVRHLHDNDAQRVLFRKAASKQPKLKPRERFLNAKIEEMLQRVAVLERTDEVNAASMREVLNSFRISKQS